MTHQLDMVPLDAAALDHAAEQLPKAREVRKPRLPEMFPPKQVEPSEAAAEVTT